MARIAIRHSRFECDEVLQSNRFQIQVTTDLDEESERLVVAMNCFWRKAALGAHVILKAAEDIADFRGVVHAGCTGDGRQSRVGICIMNANDIRI